jgi:hypothetical protein
VEKGQGDMIVSLFIHTQDKTSTKATTNQTYGAGNATYQGYGPGYGWGGGNSTTTFDEYNFTVGTLVVAAYDATKKELIWKSIGQKTVDDDPESREKKVLKTVAKIMESYPVQPGK